MQVLTSHAIRALEQRWADATGLPTLLLMERAAAGCWETIRPLSDGADLLIFAGPGNNGGDGLALARLAVLAGHRAQVVLAADPARLPGDASANLRAAIALGVPVRSIGETGPPGDEARPRVVVDALLGIGQREAPRGAVAEGLRAMREAAVGAQVVAIDVPTGIDADTGTTLAEPVAAARTVTFHGLRRAHVLPASSELCGQVRVVDIGLGVGWTTAGVTSLVDASWARGAYRCPGATAHKGTRGHVLLVCGSDRMRGAAALTARGALHAGAGLVTACTTEMAAATVLASLPEAMWLPRTDLTASACEGFDVFVVGPGLGRSEAAGRVVASTLDVAGGRPVVIDADALDPDLLRGRQLGGCVLTPHPGELARLLGCSTHDVLGDLPAAAHAAAASLGATVLAKTAGAWIHGGEDSWWVPPATSALGVGGSGDVLAGTIAALLTRHPTHQAACIGAWLHQRAGWLAATAGTEGVRASAIADATPRALAELDAG